MIISALLGFHYIVYIVKVLGKFEPGISMFLSFSIFVNKYSKA